MISAEEVDMIAAKVIARMTPLLKDLILDLTKSQLPTRRSRRNVQHYNHQVDKSAISRSHRTEYSIEERQDVQASTGKLYSREKGHGR